MKVRHMRCVDVDAGVGGVYVDGVLDLGVHARSKSELQQLQWEE